MIIKLSSVDEINKIMRNEIIAQSNLDGKKVVNGYTLHGQDLVEQVNKYCYKSFKPDDAYIVFELRPRDSYATETDYNDELTIYSPYEFHLYVYGNSSTNLVNKLVARLLTDKCRLHLQNQGVYLENITDIDNGTDFVNDTLYLRTDCNINIYCQMKIEATEDELDTLSEPINVIKENNNG